MARITYKGGTVNTVIPKITKDYRRSEYQGISITPNQVHNLISSLSTLEIKNLNFLSTDARTHIDAAVRGCPL